MVPESVLNGKSLIGGQNYLFESTIAQQYLGKKSCSQINNLTGIFTVDLVQKERIIIKSILLIQYMLINNIFRNQKLL